MRVFLTLVVMLTAVGAGAMAWLPKKNASASATDASVHTVTRGDLLVSVTEQGALESSTTLKSNAVFEVTTSSHPSLKAERSFSPTTFL